MTTSLFRQVYHGSAGIAHGSVVFSKATPLCPAFLRATLAFERIGNPEMLESPSYDISFSVGEEARAIRCLKAAARRRGLLAR